MVEVWARAQHRWWTWLRTRSGQEPLTGRQRHEIGA